MASSSPSEPEAPSQTAAPSSSAASAAPFSAPLQPWTYDTYVPTTAAQRLVLSGFSAAAALQDTNKGDMVAALGETTGEFALETMHAQLLLSQEGRDILADKPRIHEVT
jgi:ubiquinone biosynthesis protein COQ4